MGSVSLVDGHIDEPKELLCESCEHRSDDGGYCLDCYQGNKYAELKRKGGAE